MLIKLLNDEEVFECDDKLNRRNEYNPKLQYIYIEWMMMNNNQILRNDKT